MKSSVCIIIAGPNGAVKTYLRLIRKLLADGWQVRLLYLWPPSLEVASERVAERVVHGGHDIPRKFIRI